MNQAAGPQPFTARGAFGSLTVTPISIVIAHSRSSRVRSFGSREIRLESITAIQFKRANFFFQGFIRFSFAGSLDMRRGGAWSAGRDENALVFGFWQQKQFARAKALIEQYQMLLCAQSGWPPAPRAPGV